MKRLATKLIGKYGQELVLIDYVKGDYDPATGQYAKTPVEYPHFGYISNYQTTELASGLVGTADLKCLVDSKYPITKLWGVAFGGQRRARTCADSWWDYYFCGIPDNTDIQPMNIMSVKVITTQDEYITYELQLRI